jgi:hypothetical protein
VLSCGYGYLEVIPPNFALSRNQLVACKSDYILVTFIEAIMLQFTPDYRHHRAMSKRAAFSVCFLITWGALPYIRIISVDPEVVKPSKARETAIPPPSTRLQRRFCFPSSVAGVFSRGGVVVWGALLELIIPARRLDALEELLPKKRRAALV